MEAEPASGQSVQRYYDPMIPRFLSVDPVTAYSDPIGAFHRYRYANNNPYRFTDPDGRESGAAFKVVNDATNGGPITAPQRSPDDWLGPAIGVALTAIVVAPVAAEAGLVALANPAAVATATEVAAGAAGVSGVAAGIGGAGKAVGMTSHAVDQAITRGIKPAQIIDAVKNTLKTTAVKIDHLGRPSYKAIGEKATLAINPETKKIVTMNPTSTKLAEKLKKAVE